VAVTGTGPVTDGTGVAAPVGAARKGSNSMAKNSTGIDLCFIIITFFIFVSLWLSRDPES
jgi:hypothetical protein